MRLIIAKYHENIDWSNNYNRIIYDKSKFNDGDPYFCQLDGDRYYLNNIGREAHTYISHIVHNYHNLDDIEVFCQGNPLEHIPDFLEKINDLQIDNYLCFSSTKINFNRDQDRLGHYAQRQFQGPSHIWDMLFNYPMPLISSMCCHAIFAVPKECILMHELKVYEQILGWFDKSKFPGNIDEYPSLAYELEYFWHLLFNKEYHL